MASESLVFDGIELNQLTGSYVLRSVDFPPPAKRYEWVQGTDADGSALVRDPLFENRTIPISLRVAQQSTMDAALALVAQIGGKLEEAEQQEDGLPLVWTPAGSSHSVTFRVLSGEINGVPVTKTGDERGWFRFYPVVNLTLTCKPFGYGSEIAGSSVTASTPLVTTTVASVPGDVPAEARIIVTDAAGQARRDVIWGLEQHDYNAGSPASLLLAASSLVTSGFAGSSTTLSGAYSSNVIQASLFGQPTAVCGTGNQPHIGTFRARARIQADSTVVRVRLAWQDGDGPFSANAWVSPPAASALCEVDLGIITVTKATLGSQRWTGRIEAYTSDGSAQTLSVNYLALIPAGEGYGRARGEYTYKPGVAVAHDNFTGLGSGTALNGRTPIVGAAWATAGAATDWIGYIPGTPGVVVGTMVTRSTTTDATPRFGVLGPTLTDTEIQATVFGPNNQAFIGAVARYVDTSNYVSAFLTSTVTAVTTFSINIVVAGATTAYSVPLTLFAGGVGGAFRIRLIVYASGAIYALLNDDSQSNFVVAPPPGQQYAAIAVPPGTAALTSGGALASGRSGIFDLGGTAGSSGSLRIWDNVVVSTPAAEPVATFAGQPIEFRSDDVLRKDNAGTYYGRPAAYRGARALVPPAGDKNRTARVAIAARRADTDVAADSGVTDSTTLQVNVTPRYLAVPH